MPTVTEAIAKPGNEDNEDDDDYDGAAAADDDIGEVGDKDEENINNIVSSTDSSTLVTGSGHKISWKTSKHQNAPGMLRSMHSTK